MENLSGGRFRILRRLGAGGMGVVYEALDTRSGRVLALKTINTCNGDYLLRFKREFRALVDLKHPNLVELYELISDGDRWFFTLELIDGVDFVRYVHRDPQSEETDAEAAKPTWDLGRREAQRSIPTKVASAEEVRAGAACLSVSPPAPPTPVATFDLERLERALRQLCLGLTTLHEHGKIHRDVKPSNILVTKEHRVVLIDFGIVKDTTDATLMTTEAGIRGTLEYMAPELLLGAPATKQSDWYSVGTVLYVALTNRLPYLERGESVMVAKHQSDPIPPAKVNAAVSPLMNELCMGLLERRPEARLDGRSLLARLGSAGHPSNGPGLAHPNASAEGGFVARAESLLALEKHGERARQGSPAVAVVRGSPGLGKTALFSEFLRRSGGGGRRFVLGGRFHERESTRFGAFDSVVDRLTQVLGKLEREELVFVLPNEARRLSAVFPVLQRISELGSPRYDITPVEDPARLRTSAFAVLADLLGRLARLAPVVVLLDDLHNAKKEGVDLLEYLTLRAPIPGVLFLLALRPGSGQFGPALQALLKDLGASGWLLELDVPPLSQPEAMQVAREALGTTGLEPSALDGLVGQIVVEARGSPHFLNELVRHARAELAADQSRNPRPEVLRLEALVAKKLELLPPAARRVLDLAAAAKTSLGQQVVAEAAGLSLTSPEWNEALLALTQARLIKRHGYEKEDHLEILNEEFADLLLARHGEAARAEVHRTLATVLQPKTAALLAAQQWTLAGWPDRARECLEAALQAALDRGDADEAIASCHQLLELGPKPPDRLRLFETLADTYDVAGRPWEAVTAFQSAAEQAAALREQNRQEVNLSRAACLRLRTGRPALHTITIGKRRIDPADLSTVPHPVLLTFGLSRARRRALATASTWKPGAAARGDAGELQALGRMSFALLHQAPWAGAALHREHLRLSAKLGQGDAQVLALAHDALWLAQWGPRARRRVHSVLCVANVLSRRVEAPLATCVLRLAGGAVAVADGAWPQAIEELSAVELELRGAHRAATCELVVVRQLLAAALHQRGDFPELCDRFSSAWSEATRVSDAFALGALATRQAMVFVVSGRTEEAERQLASLASDRPEDGPQLWHLWAAVARCEFFLAVGRAEEALASLRANRSRLANSGLLKIPALEAEFAYVEARACLAAWTSSPKPELRSRWEAGRSRLVKIGNGPMRDWLKLADVLARRIDRSGAPTDLCAQLRALGESLDSAGNGLFGAIAKRCRGLMLGGELRAALLKETDQWFSERRVHNVEQLTNLYVPQVW